MQSSGLMLYALVEWKWVLGALLYGSFCCAYLNVILCKGNM